MVNTLKIHSEHCDSDCQSSSEGGRAVTFEDKCKCKCDAKWAPSCLTPLRGHSVSPRRMDLFTQQKWKMHKAFLSCCEETCWQAQMEMNVQWSSGSEEPWRRDRIGQTKSIHVCVFMKDWFCIAENRFHLKALELFISCLIASSHQNMVWWTGEIITCHSSVSDSLLSSFVAVKHVPLLNTFLLSELQNTPFNFQGWNRDDSSWLPQGKKGLWWWKWLFSWMNQRAWA